ncbi:L-seryl-tRNA(Sec) selenium transferase [Verrucomicrobiota bacterium]
MTAEQLKNLPPVDAVLALPNVVKLVEEVGRSRVVTAIRQAVDTVRSSILNEQISDNTAINPETILKKAEELIAQSSSAILKPAINATGIILHTGLGRAVMPETAREALSCLTGYCNIQMDLSTGNRIKREENIRDLINDLTGAEDVLLVNNNAGATLLTLKALAEHGEVIVSRGELIEIGGSFRLPEIMEQSGAVMKEVGSTNKTHLRDYKKALSDKTALLFKAHKSNYQIVGFSKEVDISEIAALGKEHNIPVVDDLGCGALINIEQFGLPHEMTVRESLEAGSDITLFSSDKLIGGPQGGLIVGKKELLDKIRSHPLYRALRVGKMTLAALESTLRLFKSPEHLSQKHPVYIMLSKTPEEIKIQAEKLAKLISAKKPKWSISVVEEKSYIGGGTAPDSSLPSFAVSISDPSESTNDLAKQLRQAETPIIPHVREDAVLLNMRTVFSEEEKDILKAVTKS